MEKNERMKLLVVIGLAAVFVAVGYFRFLHGKVAFFAKPAAVPAAPMIEIPAIDLKGAEPREPKITAPEGLRATLRDIFEPPKPPPPIVVAPVTAEATEPKPPPLPPFKLDGMIAGGKRPLAIINGRFLRKGESIEGFEVVSITRDRVTLAGAGRTVVLNPLTGIEEVVR